MMVPASRTETFGEIPIRPRHNSPEIANIDNGRVSLKNSQTLNGYEKGDIFAIGPSIRLFGLIINGIHVKPKNFRT